MTILSNRVIRRTILLIALLGAALAQNERSKDGDEEEHIKIKATGRTKSVVDDGFVTRQSHLNATELSKRDLEKLPDMTFEFLSNEKELKFKHIESNTTKKEGEKAWYGEDDETDEVNIIQTESGEIFGSATTPEAIYQFHTAPDGSMEVTEILTEDLPPELEPEEDDSEDESEDDSEEEYRGLRGSDNRRLQNDDGSCIDIMVVYTKEAMCQKATGKRSMNCEENHKPVLGVIDQMFQEANQAFKNSKINTQVCLVHAYMDPDYVEGGNFQQYMRDLRGDVLKGVKEKRNKYAADLVTMLAAHGNACGVGHKSNGRESLGYNVVNIGCAVGYFSFAHEVGHNFGCNHNIENTGAKTEFPAYGYRDTDSNIRSIMGIAPGQRLQYFSNLDVNVRGKSFGTSKANNAAKINDLIYAVANYRKSATRVSDSSPPAAPAPPAATTPGSSSGTLQIFGAGNIYYYGSMFDMKALSGNVKVTGMEVDLYTNNNAKIEVYTKNTSYRTSLRNGWKKVGEATVKGEGYGKAVSLPSSIFGNGVAINKGQTRGFWVVSSAKVIVISKSRQREGTTIASDSNIAITCGRYTNYNSRRNPHFSRAGYPYEFNGSVTYEKV